MLQNTRAFSSRDYVGLISFDTYAVMEQNLIRMNTEGQRTMQNAIRGLRLRGGTLYGEALRMAYRYIGAIPGVERRHIVFLTDGYPNDGYNHRDEILRHRAQRGITLSAVGIAGTFTMAIEMSEAGGGEPHLISPRVSLPSAAFHGVYDEIRDIQRSLAELTRRNFLPRVSLAPQPEFEGIAADLPFEAGSNTVRTLPSRFGGFYGVAARRDAETILVGPYAVPIYARRQYGRGRVGALATNILEEDWGEGTDFLDCAVSRRFLFNAIRALSPTENIRPTEITLRIGERNFSRSLEIITHVSDNANDYFYVTVTRLGDPNRRSFTVSYRESALTFSLWEPGVYEIEVQQRNSSNEVRAQHIIYTTFPYSSEYDAFGCREEAERLMLNLAAGGRGKMITNPEAVYEGFPLTENRTANPRVALIIIAIILILADVAARKFKWKWPWEIVRDRRALQQARGV